ncbi:MAG: thioredoxin domain-containing protein [Gemmatimonadaceae bacterium]
MTPLLKLSRVDALWGALALAAVLATAAFAREQIARAARPANAVGRRTINAIEPRTINDGARIAEAGIIVGDSAAPVRVVEFLDFECRYCQRFQRTLAELRARHPKGVAVVYRHFPISRVGYSLPAAVAAECAAAQGRFESFAELLFAAQDTLARVVLEAAALQAGVSDTARFRACRAGPAARARVDEDIRAATRLGITATPTVLVADQLLVGEVPLEKLELLMRTASKERRVR